jgi:hypothetical protein
MNMQPIQWLLVGGPADGKTIWIKCGASVIIRADDGDVLYIGQNWLENGKLYRVGAIETNDLQPSKVRGLIESTGLQHIAGS